MTDPAASPTPSRAALDPVDLAFQASGVVLVVLVLLLVASILVWFIWFLKLGQLARLRSKHQSFEREASTVELPSDLLALARRHADSPGGRVVAELAGGAPRMALRTSSCSPSPSAPSRRAAAANTLMPTLSSIAPRRLHRPVRYVWASWCVLAHRRREERVAPGGGSSDR